MHCRLICSVPNAFVHISLYSVIGLYSFHAITGALFFSQYQTYLRWQGYLIVSSHQFCWSAGFYYIFVELSSEMCQPFSSFLVLVVFRKSCCLPKHSLKYLQSTSLVTKGWFYWGYWYVIQLENFMGLIR